MTKKKFILILAAAAAAAILTGCGGTEQRSGKNVLAENLLNNTETTFEEYTDVSYMYNISITERGGKQFTGTNDIDADMSLSHFKGRDNYMDGSVNDFERYVQSIDGGYRVYRFEDGTTWTKNEGSKVSNKDISHGISMGTALDFNAEDFDSFEYAGKTEEQYKVTGVMPCNKISTFTSIISDQVRAYYEELTGNEIKLEFDGETVKWNVTIFYNKETFLPEYLQFELDLDDDTTGLMQYVSDATFEFYYDAINAGNTCNLPAEVSTTAVDKTEYDEAKKEAEKEAEKQLEIQEELNNR